MNTIRPILSQTPNGPYQIVKIDAIFHKSFTGTYVVGEQG